jgi:2-keto-3-deoxy-L-rhamnonate aldolase RhmA
MKAAGSPFCHDDGTPRTLAGLNVYSGSTRLAELGARTGFDVVWIDMEHATCDLRAAEAMCVAVEAGGGIPLQGRMYRSRAFWSRQPVRS